MCKLKYLLILLYVAPAFGVAQTSKEYNSQGIAKAKAMDYKGAIEEYNKALKIDSTDWTVLYNLGISKAKLQDYSGAITDYTKSIGIHPDAASYFNRAISSFKSSRYDDAITDLDTTLAMNPKISPEVYFLRGSSKFMLKDYEAALTDFSKSIEMNPEDGKSFLYRGITEHHLNMRTASCGDLQRAEVLGHAKAAENIKKFCQ
jgi:tetratricopeptide (TPR) repeat protein